MTCIPVSRMDKTGFVLPGLSTNSRLGLFNECAGGQKCKAAFGVCHLVQKYGMSMQAEKASFLEFAPAYFEHAAKSVLSGQRTCLAKVLGMYQVSAKTLAGVLCFMYLLCSCRVVMFHQQHKTKPHLKLLNWRRRSKEKVEDKLMHMRADCLRPSAPEGGCIMSYV